MNPLKSFDSNTYTDLDRLKGQRVLIVDDDLDSLELTALILADWGVETLTAKCAREALKLFLEFSPQVLICDLAMPIEDGYELIRKIRKSEAKLKRHVLAIALTAMATEESLQNARFSGFQVCLTKPFDPDDLLTTLVTYFQSYLPLSLQLPLFHQAS